LVIDDNPDNCVNVDLLNAGSCEALVAALVVVVVVVVLLLLRGEGGCGEGG